MKRTALTSVVGRIGLALTMLASLLTLSVSQAHAEPARQKTLGLQVRGQVLG